MSPDVKVTNDTRRDLRVRTDLTLRYARRRVRSRPIGHEIAVSTKLEAPLAAASRSDIQPLSFRSPAIERQMMQEDAIIGTARQMPTIPPISAPTSTAKIAARG